MRVYVADDNEEFSLVLRRVAESLGHKVTTCANGRELFREVVSEIGPALLLIDIDMPEMDGIEVIEVLKTIPRRLRVRFMTGGQESSAFAARMIASARGLDAGRFITKPISVEDFKEILESEALHLV